MTDAQVARVGLDLVKRRAAWLAGLLEKRGQARIPGRGLPAGAVSKESEPVPVFGAARIDPLQSGNGDRHGFL
ncbi:MAG: hypothetical protein K8H90_01100, partial [Thermoanaerobaculia bacterium]|nr:hypothetical protein [Thermoanaerobaculia bacterium]